MNKNHLDNRSAEAHFASRVAARLDAGSMELPYDITERLRAARMQALAQRRPAPVLRLSPSLQTAGGAATLGFGGGDAPGWWTRLASALPLVALVAGLVAINMIQSEHRANELAEVDTALLTDDLPPAAYADPGFAQYLQSGTDLGQ